MKNKPILILGAQGTGKTLLLNKMFSEKINNKNGAFIKLSMSAIHRSIRNMMLETICCGLGGLVIRYIFIDEVSDIRIFSIIIDKIAPMSRTEIVVASQLSSSEVPEDILDKFEVVYTTPNAS